MEKETRFIDVLVQMDKRDLPKTKTDFVDFLQHYLDELNENKYLSIRDFLDKYKDV